MPWVSHIETLQMATSHIMSVIVLKFYCFNQFIYVECGKLVSNMLFAGTRRPSFSNTTITNDSK